MGTVYGYLEDDTFTKIANAIRSKNGSAGKYTPDQMAEAINAMDTGGIRTNDATMEASDILKGKTGYANGTKLTGTLEVINYYTGINDPDNSFGEEDDIYIKTE